MANAGCKYPLRDSMAQPKYSNTTLTVQSIKVYLFKSTCFGLELDHDQVKRTFIKKQVKYVTYHAPYFFVGHHKFTIFFI